MLATIANKRKIEEATSKKDDVAPGTALILDDNSSGSAGDHPACLSKSVMLINRYCIQHNPPVFARSCNQLASSCKWGYLESISALKAQKHNYLDQWKAAEANS